MLVPLHYYLLLLLDMHFSGNNCKGWLRQAQPPGIRKAQPPGLWVAHPSGIRKAQRQESLNNIGTTKQKFSTFH